MPLPAVKGPSPSLSRGVSPWPIICRLAKHNLRDFVKHVIMSGNRLIPDTFPVRYPRLCLPFSLYRHMCMYPSPCSSHSPDLSLSPSPHLFARYDSGELFVHVEARLRAGSAWAPEGHLVAWGCFPVTDIVPAGKAPLALVPHQPPPWRSSTTSQGDFQALAGGKGVPPVGEAVATPGTVPRSPPTLVVYEDDGDSSAPSGEASPMGQL